MSDLAILETESNEFASYAYSYPHKSSYGPLSPPVPIEDAWREEDVSRLALYLHLPFCEMRCGFCNLFTQSQPQLQVVDDYLRTLFRQMGLIRARLPTARFAQFAIGGGTPTFLAAAQLESLLVGLEATFEFSIAMVPTSVETSPATATIDRLRVLKDFGVQRISIGIQSFVAAELQRIGRPQDLQQVDAALDAIRHVEFPMLNIDLIYGDPLQTIETWLASLTHALCYQPEELYLYPLYVRPGTGLGRAGGPTAEHRRDLYRLACERLQADGYVQSSLRCFRRRASGTASDPRYACQQDGMLGLGCGARSYTRRLHYSSRFAVRQADIQSILQDWVSQPDADLALATHGLWLTEIEPAPALCYSQPAAGGRPSSTRLSSAVRQCAV